MNRMQNKLWIVLILFIGCKNSSSNQLEETPSEQKTPRPTVSFTFDDGSTNDIEGFKFEDWNQMILSSLEAENLKAIFFVTGKNKLDKKGHFLLKSWNDKGHKIANHSFSHRYYNSEKNTPKIFESELKSTDSIISKFNNGIKLFRFPYLKEGENKSKVDSLRAILTQHNYKNGYVTIDASDWYVNQRLIKRIKDVGFEKTEIEKFKDFYIQHLMERANYYEKLSFQINNRHIKHTLLLHHNLTSALFLDDLIEEFKNKGWEVIDADLAYEDRIYKTIPDSDFAGESLIYSLAKQSKINDQIFRYPAEDGRYEKDKMDSLGL